VHTKKLQLKWGLTVASNLSLIWAYRLSINHEMITVGLWLKKIIVCVYFIILCVVSISYVQIVSYHSKTTSLISEAKPYDNRLKQQDDYTNEHPYDTAPNRSSAFHITEDSPPNTSQNRTRSTTKQSNHCLENQKGGYYLRYTKTGKRSCRIITDSYHKTINQVLKLVYLIK